MGKAKLLLLAIVLASVGAASIRPDRTIAEIASRGALIVLDDNTIWLVDRMDRFKSAVWMKFENIEIRQTNTRGVYQLVNFDQKESVFVTYLGKT